MHYYSLKGQSPDVGFRDAAIHGQAPDGGLYFPRAVPPLSASWIESLGRRSKAKTAFDVIQPFVGEDIPASVLFGICEETLNFDFPVRRINDRISSLELYHGPTLAFKDVGARFMSRCLAWFSKDTRQRVTVLVATSGDTGGAVASGFLDVEGVEVVILYPSKRVSRIQELQLTTLGNNIQALEVQGSFDDCQRMVKQAFADEELNKKLFLTSANSINVARWLPQQFYYFLALRAWEGEEPPVISVPSGNFGNLCAGLLAQRRGLPVKHFIAACNSNRVFTEFMHTGVYAPQATIPTLSNAMDVGDPSNFVRVLELFRKDYGGMQDLITSFCIRDEETEETVSRIFREEHYLLDPHGAVAYQALERYLESHPEEQGLILETAHPVKFSETVERITGHPVEIPEEIKALEGKEKRSTVISPDYNILREYLQDAKVRI